MRVMQHNRIIAGGFVERVATPAPFVRSQRSSFPSWKAQNVWRQRNNPMQPTRTVEDFMPLHLTKGAESFAGLRGSKTRKYHLCQVDDCPRSSCLTLCYSTNAKPSLALSWAVIVPLALHHQLSFSLTPASHPPHPLYSSIGPES